MTTRERARDGFDRKLLAPLISGAVLGSWPEPYHLLAFGLILAGIMCSALRRQAPTQR